MNNDASRNRVDPRPVRQRTCIATRSTKPASMLLRLVARTTPGDEGKTVVSIIPDEKATLPGRGAWITPTLEALELAEKRRAFNRAFRTGGPIDTTLVRQLVDPDCGNENKKRMTDH